MSDKFVSLEVNSNLAKVLIDREDRLNALNSDVLLELSSALDSVPNNVSLIFIKTAGEKAFVAGADISEMQAASEEELVRFVELGQEVMRKLEEHDALSVAVVDGFALGGGFELALACDLIVSNKRAKFGLPEIDLGLIPGFGGTQRLTKRVGVGVAKRLVFSAETLNAEQAHSLGLSDYLLDLDDWEDDLAKLIIELSSKAPLALKAAKRSIEKGVAEGPSNGLELEKSEFLKLFKTEDASEGLSAFLEKRKANFRGI